MTKDEAIDIMRDAGFGFFATTNGTQPHVRPMMPYLMDDNKHLLLALLGRSRTLQDVKLNPQVEICFVDRKMWYARVTGVATITDDKDKKEILWENIPMLRQYFGGAEDPNFHLMVVEIKAVEAMTPHQKTPEKITL